jgi:hypothetical protein
MTAEAETTNRAQVWAEAQRLRTACPECGKHMSVRTLRWKHTCRDRTPRVRRPRMLDAEQAEERRRGLEELAAAALRFRLSGRGPASGVPSPQRASRRSYTSSTHDSIHPFGRVP